MSFLSTESFAQVAFWIVVGFTIGGACIAVFPRNILYNVLGLALALAGVAGLYLFLGSMFIPSFILFALLLSPVAGGLIAEVVRLAVRRRRSPRLFKMAALGALVGALPVALLELATSIMWMVWAGSFDTSIIPALIGHGLYIALVTTSTFYRMNGLQLRG